MRSTLDRIYARLPKRIKMASLAAVLSVRSFGNLHAVRIVEESNELSHEIIVRFRRKGNRLDLQLTSERFLSSTRSLNTLWKRLPIMLDLLSRTSSIVDCGTLDLSDGYIGEETRFAFCSNSPNAILVPDRSFYLARSYRPYRVGASKSIAWSDRDSTLVWRGGANGWGALTNSTMRHNDHDLMQRVCLCLALAGMPGTDVCLVNLGRNELDRAEQSRITEQWCELGILGSTIPAMSWFSRKFAIDIDGHTNAWSNLYTRLLMGCCVMKVASPRGFRQWYYEDLKPWEHYVPIAADLSDLTERVQWCQAHDHKCEAIARAGQQFALSRTRETEIDRTVRAIESRYKNM
jgi:hypothetical protein